jgi:hypothetical protein
MRKKLLALMALAGLALAQTTDSHTVTVNIPSVLQLTIDATDFLFNFNDTNLTGSETVTVGGTPYTQASYNAYTAFLAGSNTTQSFAPTSVAGTGGNNYATATVVTNRAQWTVKIDTVSGNLPPPLDNSRVQVFAEKASGKGTSATTSPTPIANGMALFSASTGGTGKSVYKLYYLLKLDQNDDIPTSGYANQQITVNYLLTTP